VVWRDIDDAKIVNNPFTLEYIEECGFQAVAAHGWPVERMSAAGFAIFIRRHQIQYQQPARLDDELEIATWASEVRRSTAIRHYTLHRLGDGDLVARVHSLGVWIDLATGRPVRIPAEFIADFAPNLVSG
jgi:acyl-CoA thioester hydrolase